MEAEITRTGQSDNAGQVVGAPTGGVVPRMLGRVIGTEAIAADITGRIAQATRDALDAQGAAWREALQATAAQEVQRNVAVMDRHLAEQLEARLGRMQETLGVALQRMVAAEVTAAAERLEERLRGAAAATAQGAAAALEAQLAALTGPALDAQLRHAVEVAVAQDSQQRSLQLAEHLISHLDARTADLQGRSDAGLHAMLDAGLARHANALQVELLGAVAAERTSLAQEVHRQMHHVDSHLSAHLSKELSLQLGQRRQEVRAGGRSVQERLLALGRLLQPVTALGPRKRRVGRAGDGGYVMLDDLSRAAFALSLGVGDEMTWDLEMAGLGIAVHQFDYTIAVPPEVPARIVFHRSRIAPVAAGEDHSFASAQALGGHQPCIIKMDIEGDEWAVLEAAGETDFAQVTQLVVELHDFDRVEDPAWAERAERVLRALARDFSVVHVHANNNGLYRTIDNVAFPEILEVTFANRRFYEFGPAAELFPTELDVPNREDLPEIILGAFRF